MKDSLKKVGFDDFLNKLGGKDLFSSIKNYFTGSKKKKKSVIKWKDVITYNGKLNTNCKIIGDKMLILDEKNEKFHMNVYHQDANNFYEIFKDDYKSLDIEKVFEKEIETFEKTFNEDVKGNKTSAEKINLRIENGKLTNREERGNILKYDYIKNGEKAGQLIFYMFSNQKLHPIDVITVKKKSKNIRTYKDIEYKYGILSDNQELQNDIKEGSSFLFPYYNFDINLYNIRGYLIEMLYYIYYMTFSLFFKKNEKLKSYYKSKIINIQNLTSNLKDDIEIRNDIKGIVKNKDWYNLGKALKKVVPGNFDITYYYCFYSIKQKLYPCYIKVEKGEIKGKELDVQLSINIGQEGFSHSVILNIFKNIQALEAKSFIYENLEDFNVQRDVGFISYDQIKNIKKIIESYKILFN